MKQVTYEPGFSASVTFWLLLVWFVGWGAAGLYALVSVSAPPKVLAANCTDKGGVMIEGYCVSRAVLIPVKP